jgi:hypothetical protein
MPLRAALISAVAALAALPSALAPAAARADATQESTFQDDQYLIYNTSAGVNHTLARLRSLGVTRVRVNVKWSTIAPDPTSSTPPAGFNPVLPSDYPAANWVPYDRLVEYAAAYGIGVDFNVTAPGPLWAMRHDSPTTRAADHWAPNVAEFTAFVYALGYRYSGTYTPPAQASSTVPSSSPGILGLPIKLPGLTGPPAATTSQAPSSSTALPRVDYWSVWNEPDQPGWLAPQWRKYRGKEVLNSPRLYREYAEAAYTALYFTGHIKDTILIGELAPEGYTTPGYYNATTPMPFLRAMYCVDSHYRRLTGEAASALGCPTKGSAKAFVDANPVLFYATGFAHHPYFFYHPPSYTTPDPDFVPLADLGRLEHGLDRSLAAYGSHRHLPIYLTEYGYQTNPPDPRQVVTPAEQAAYLNQSDYIAWRDPRVRSVSQFLLYDAAPNAMYPTTSPDYWDTFQTGLLYLDGRQKPAYAAYRLPIWIPSTRVRARTRMFVWGEIRPGPHTVPQRATIQWRATGGKWTTIATVRFRQAEGYFTTRVRPPGSGTVQIAWRSPSGHVYTSRSVPIRVG